MRRAAVVVSAACLGVWALVRWVLAADPQVGDTGVYEHATRMIDAGFVPYRDFDVEYPPVATGFFWAVGQLPGEATLRFSLVMALCLVAMAVATLIASAQLELPTWRRVLSVATVVLIPILLGTLVQTRFDLLLTALLAWTLVATLAKRFGWMWTLLAIATAVKLVPIVLVPVLAVWHARHRGWGRSARGVALFSGSVAATFAPFFAISPSGMWRMFAYHLDRPLQIETLGSAIAHAVGAPFHHVQSFGSENIDGALPGVLASLSTIALVVSVAAIAAYSVRHGKTQDRDMVVAAVAATMVAAVVFGKVLSPQYVLWVLPAAMLLRGRRGDIAALVMVVILPMTQLIFPVLMSELIDSASPLAVWILVGRDVLLVAILLLVWPRGRGDRTPDEAPVARSDTRMEPLPQ